MRRLLAILLMISLFILPAITSCVPGGYEGDNPARPEENQVDPEQIEGETDPAPEGGTTEPEGEPTEPEGDG